ncbi:hypothetical protein [Marinigracilibium pacificum]|uniref:NAD(+)--protein-arginine ADP-ribosyltransferase n=1 Tax=Marinigracilibium pacificum TaxID=2729599 RepID=A0A848J7M6_9BACT|nr:hypothetical protein [Marinigracilibium pacificum]NMM50490.1 hypothetical protein [Marinigracilibium pacificum]
METDIADDFMSRKGGSVVLVIEPKSGKSIGEISAAFESEILFKSKTKFEVVSKSYRPRFTPNDPLVREIHIKEVD